MKKETFLKLQKEAKKLKQSNLMSSWWVLRATLLTSLWITALSSGSLPFIILGSFLGPAVVYNWVSLLHESGHGHFFTARWVNTIVGLIASWFSLLPYEQWRITHLLHHKWTGYFDKDPTSSGPNKTIIKDKQKKIVDFAWKYSIPLFVPIFYFRSFWNPFFTLQFSKSASKKVFQIFCLFFMLLPYIILTALIGWKFLAIICPSFFLTLIIADPFLLSQHNYFERQYFDENKSDRPVPLREQDIYTRELVFPPFIANFVFMNFNYHVSHHFFPKLPGYCLPKLKYESASRMSWSRWLFQSKKIPGHKILMDFGPL